MASLLGCVVAFADDFKITCGRPTNDALGCLDPHVEWVLLQKHDDLSLFDLTAYQISIFGCDLKFVGSVALTLLTLDLLTGCALTGFSIA